MNNDIHFTEYGGRMNGCIRKTQPGCPKVAVIPTVVVENINGLKGLSDCFVHVSNTNTTYYIDDKHGIIITWAGPVEVNDYTAETNPLGLRSQTCYDFKNNVAYYFDKRGAYRRYSLESE